MTPPSFQIENPKDSITEDDSVSKKRRNIVTPWQNIAEFEEVRNYIYGTNSNSNTWRQAIVELKIWANRTRSRCPAAVFATLTMLEAKLHEENTHLEESQLQSLYAFALIRFFNFMSSTIQTYNMRSMYNTAKTMNLASFVVDLRHICAHGTELPELLLLRQTTNYCLNWLYGYYWSVQTQNMINADTECLQHIQKPLRKCADIVESLFDYFDIAFECHLNACSTPKQIKERIRGQRLTKFKSYWAKEKLSSIRETFDAVLVNMIYFTKQGIPNKHLAFMFTQGFIKMKYFFSFVENHNIDHELPDILSVVQDLFRFLAVHNLIESILCKLYEFVENPKNSQTQRAGATFWIKQIITGMTVFVTCKKHYFNTYDEDTKAKLNSKFEKLSKNTRQTYNDCNVDLERTIIFGDSFQRPWVWSFRRGFLQKRVKAINEYTAETLQSLIALIRPKITEEENNKLKKISSVYLKEDNIVSSSDNTSESETSDKVYTLSDICLDENSSHMEDSNADSPDSAGWIPLPEDEYDWSNCPIGRVPWQ